LEGFTIEALGAVFKQHLLTLLHND
jgi:hypothetical protein